MHIPSIPSTRDAELAKRLQHAIDNKTKPLGSLGLLESLAHQIGLIQQRVDVEISDPAIMVFAGDHGVCDEGVSAFPQDVSWQMVENFLANGAGINVFATQTGCRLQVIDAGVKHDFGDRPGLINRKVAWGTANFAKQAAMTIEQCEQALQHGIDLARELPGNIVGFGEMGIGNTTPASALLHKYTGVPVANCVGAGAGLSSEGIRRKQEVIERAVALHGEMHDPLQILATFGGLEIAMMAGAMLQSAAMRKILLIDGFITSSALLAAARIQPNILDYCIFAHASDEAGHKHMLSNLGARPVLHLSLRLGEGTGSALALPIVQAAVNFLRNMATFESAEVSTQSA
jgi:nicotinate-nucleotide--dimethylbenzimidazole phosphoribosyltransferase